MPFIAIDMNDTPCWYSVKYYQSIVLPLLLIPSWAESLLAIPQQVARASIWGMSPSWQAAAATCRQ